ncbi:unnamed protein product [Brassicogethes aeneus]|uniref:MULE transposase domain-containing protein n=1 Tax=Brassicogethes aeneus TaxID=1431903 RepID=A0A9P0BHE6_BRAAE|nr:unnamed protein product [Brassicogethes aeneus]
MDYSPINTALEEFNDYFVGEWLENDAIGNMWNCYKEKHRTTNSLEAWHSKLNRRLGKVNPNVCQLVSALKENAIHNTFLQNRLEINLTPSKRSQYSNIYKFGCSH